MTRFARAKGSKSSNERLPDEPTPWHVMKQQLESTLDKDQVPQTKTKTAKQLLNENEDLYYAKSLGNVNSDWAEFEKPKTKNAVIDGKVDKKPKDQNKKVKKAFKNSTAEESTPKHETNKTESKNVKIEVENTSKQAPETTVSNKRNIKVEDISVQATEKTEIKNEKVEVENTTKQVTDKRKNKKFKVKAENVSKHENERTEDKKEGVKTENTSEQKTQEHGAFNKLSKRQKRNHKKQTQKTEDKSECTATFNVEGNDWDNSVSFNKRRKFDDNQDRTPMRSGGPNNNRERQFNSNFDDKNFNRFGNNVPRKFQKKTAKIRDDRNHQRRKPDNSSMKVTINGMDVEIVKYDGFPIKKEDAQRLTELRKEMVLKGIPKSEIDAAMKLERRKCEKALTRIKKQVCFHCRKAGHNLSDCPELGEEEAGTGICFKCGSTEHTHFECKVNKSDDYRYAKCFICREQGHISKQCPDNPKGLYPDGGACKICGDVTHLKKDCPDLVKEKEETAITLDTIRDTNLEVLDDEMTKVKSEIKPSKKIVKF